ncbi:MAG: AEC family transporter [Steroidobacteraceae bacterium]
MTSLLSFLTLTFAMLVLGALLQRLRQAEAMANSFNWWSLNVALPAVVLELLPALPWHATLWYLVASQWLGFVVAFVVIGWLGRLLGWTPGRTAAVILMCGASNTAFIGYPMIEAMRGRDGLSLAVIADQLGCMPVIAVGGALVAALYSGHARPGSREILKRIALFPAFWAIWIGFTLGALHLNWPDAVAQTLHRVGQSMGPLVLFAIGLRLRLTLPRAERGAIFLSMGWKLLLAPAATLALGWLLGVSGLILTVAVLQMAMAPMFTAAMICHHHKLDPDLANSVVSVGLLLSFATVPLWNAWL